MDSTIIILLLCSVVIISYSFEIFAKRTGIPSVLFLILFGVVLNRLALFFDTPSIDYLQLIPVVGTVGLILIVFEGALEIEYNREKRKFFGGVFLVSVVLLTATAICMALLFSYKTGLNLYQCFLNSIPFAIISSAIAIPSAAHLTVEKREFITFESSLSDILGIVLFNYALANTTLSFYLGWKITMEIIIVSCVSFLFCLVLLYLLRSIEHNIKFILILAVMVFLYTLGKLIHVSSLIMVLMFGLLLKNINMVKSDFIKKHFNNLQYLNEFNLMQQITAEGVFLVKTFFFIIFGFIIEPRALITGRNISTALLIAGVVYGVRLLSLLFLRRKVFPEIFYAPRGLISILLYLSIPSGLYIELININVLFLVVIFTSTIMIMGSFWKGYPEVIGNYIKQG